MFVDVVVDSRASLPKIFTHSPKTLTTAGHVPDEALFVAARACWMVLATVREQTSQIVGIITSKCLHQSQHLMQQPQLHFWKMGVGRALMIIPHLLVDLITV